MFIQEPIEDFPLCSSKPNQCNFALKHPTADVVCPIGHRGYFLVVAHMPPTEGAHCTVTQMYLKGCKSHYIRKLLFRLFSTKFCNNRCKRCNPEKRKLNVYTSCNCLDWKLFHMAFKGMAKVIFSYFHLKRQSWQHSSLFPTFETGSVCNLCQDKRRAGVERTRKERKTHTTDAMLLDPGVWSRVL